MQNSWCMQLLCASWNRWIFFAIVCYMSQYTLSVAFTFFPHSSDLPMYKQRFAYVLSLIQSSVFKHIHIFPFCRHWFMTSVHSIHSCFTSIKHDFKYQRKIEIATPWQQNHLTLLIYSERRRILNMYLHLYIWWYIYIDGLASFTNTALCIS